jgi:methyl-accepting chemotaxis protein
VHPDAEKLSNMKSAIEWAERNAPSARKAAEAMISGNTGFESFRMNDEDWYVFYKPFRHTASVGLPLDQLGWSAGVVYLKDDILGSYNTLIYIEVGIVILGLLLFFLLNRALIRRHLKHLHVLIRSAQRVAEGHYDETVPTAQSDDEIGQLQDLFRRMQQSLAAKSTELEQLTKRLTQRGEELRKAYGSVQGVDRMRTSFLHYMTMQMTVPSDLIERSVIKLSNQYDSISPQEAAYEVSVIKEQSGKIIDLLDHMVEALQFEAEETVKDFESGKEVSHE